MSFEMIQKLRYIFDGYSLAFILGTGIYGLLVDVKQSKEKGSDRDIKIAKRMYITLIALIVAIFITVKLM